MKDFDKLTKSFGIEPKTMKRYCCIDCGRTIISNEFANKCSECEEKESNKIVDKKYKEFLKTLTDKQKDYFYTIYCNN